jgi:hypothetical protein
VKSTDAVHKYLISKGWEHHIPKSFRTIDEPGIHPRRYTVPDGTPPDDLRDQQTQKWDTIHQSIGRRISQKIKQKKAIATAASLNVIMSDTPDARQHSVNNYLFNVQTNSVETFLIEPDELLTCDVNETFPTSQLQFGHGPLRYFLLR